MPDAPSEREIAKAIVEAAVRKLIPFQEMFYDHGNRAKFLCSVRACMARILRDEYHFKYETIAAAMRYASHTSVLSIEGSLDAYSDDYVFRGSTMGPMNGWTKKMIVAKVRTELEIAKVDYVKKEVLG